MTTLPELFHIGSPRDEQLAQKTPVKSTPTAAACLITESGSEQTVSTPLTAQSGTPPTVQSNASKGPSSTSSSSSSSTTSSERQKRKEKAKLKLMLKEAEEETLRARLALNEIEEEDDEDDLDEVMRSLRDFKAPASMDFKVPTSCGTATRSA